MCLSLPEMLSILVSISTSQQQLMHILRHQSIPWGKLKERKNMNEKTHYRGEPGDVTPSFGHRIKELE